MKMKNENKCTARRRLSFLLAALMIAALALTGCGSSDDGKSKAKTDGGKDLPRIGIIQLKEHQSLDTIREAIIAELAAEGYVDGETCIIDYQNGQGDPSNMKTIAQKFKADSCNIIIAIATPAAQAAAGETTEIPIIFSAITDPTAASLVKSMEEPGGNITGTSDAVSAVKIMELAQQISPGFKTIGVLYNTGEDNSVSVVADLKEYAEKNNMKVVEGAISSDSEAQQAASVLASKVDIAFSPIDNSIASNMPVVTQAFDSAKVPFYVSADSMVATGGLATYGINYEVLGEETAKMAVEVLKGADPATLPVRTMDDMSTYVNTDTAKRIGITIPQDILDSATLFTDADAVDKK